MNIDDDNLQLDHTMLYADMLICSDVKYHHPRNNIR